MAISQRNMTLLQNAVSCVCNEISRTELLPRPWEEWSEDELWRELAGCILGSRVPYEQALAAASYLHSTGLLYPRPGKGDLRRYELRLRRVLKQRVFRSSKHAILQKYRFPNLRANHLRRTAESIYIIRGTTLRELLISSPTSMDARVCIVSTAIGAGPKQTSLFLRNIGYGDDLAILDMHVLRYMTWIRLASTRANEVQTLPGYLRTENLFRSHAKQMGVSVANLDLAVWIVVRVIQSELNREPGKLSVGWN
jgi:N-glycosylase/DNA lyase